ncbi:MAG: DUF1794 domain-containing protein [Nitriliruptorales bacterium]|nr:DUF1794 domain-containing protein [Nitriliruptorales bacterium]
MELHPALAVLAPLVGRWRGEGRGEYPTIEPFTYGEEATFAHVGKPFLAYTQRTWSLDTGAPLHAEAGYWRAGGDGRIEVTLSHPFGAVEVLVGTMAGGRLHLASQAVVTTPTAKRIDAIERDIDFDGDVLRYRIRMAAVGEPMTHHLAAELSRSS